jgi:hypothetical protein
MFSFLISHGRIRRRKSVAKGHLSSKSFQPDQTKTVLNTAGTPVIVWSGFPSVNLRSHGTIIHRFYCPNHDNMAAV